MAFIARTYQLNPVDSRKSFYGKALVKVMDDGTEVLHSYDTDVMVRKPDGTLVRLWWDWSATTGRHIYAFCGLRKADLDKMEHDPDAYLTTDRVAYWAQKYGNASAASLLLLTPPSKFLGDYEATFARLTTEVTTKPGE